MIRKWRVVKKASVASVGVAAVIALSAASPAFATDAMKPGVGHRPDVGNVDPNPGSGHRPIDSGAGDANHIHYGETGPR
jgi:hypothetical protein